MATGPNSAVDDVQPVVDDELAELALRLDADAPIAADAVDVWTVLGLTAHSPLPTWYQPAPMGVRRLEGWRRHVARLSAALVIASFVVINAFGLCNTYGQLHV